MHAPWHDCGAKTLANAVTLHDAMLHMKIQQHGRKRRTTVTHWTPARYIREHKRATHENDMHPSVMGHGLCVSGIVKRACGGNAIAYT